MNQEQTEMIETAKRLKVVFDAAGVESDNYLVKTTKGELLFAPKNYDPDVFGNPTCHGPWLHNHPNDPMASGKVLERMGVKFVNSCYFIRANQNLSSLNSFYVSDNEIQTELDYIKAICSIGERVYAREILIARLEDHLKGITILEEELSLVKELKRNNMHNALICKDLMRSPACMAIVDSTPHWQMTPEERKPFDEAWKLGGLK